MVNLRRRLDNFSIALTTNATTHHDSAPLIMPHFTTQFQILRLNSQGICAIEKSVRSKRLNIGQVLFVVVVAVVYGMRRSSSKVHKHEKKNEAILTGQARSKKDLLNGKRTLFPCGIQDSVILPVPVAIHGDGFMQLK